MKPEEIRKLFPIFKEWAMHGKYHYMTLSMSESGLVLWYEFLEETWISTKSTK